jgi:hypothetical protein
MVYAAMGAMQILFTKSDLNVLHVWISIFVKIAKQRDFTRNIKWTKL